MPFSAIATLASLITIYISFSTARLVFLRVAVFQYGYDPKSSRRAWVGLREIELFRRLQPELHW
jgi:hypothetical protein